MKKNVKTLLAFTVFLLFPFPAMALQHVIHIEWVFQNTDTVAGFRLYHENSAVCSTDDPKATSMSCSIDAAGGESFFTLATVYKDGSESPHSPPYALVFPSGPKAVPEADVVAGQSPLTVNFTAISSTGDIQSYEWDFGDGENGTGPTVSHTFTAAGRYSVSLEVVDDRGAASESTITVTVSSPVATGNDAPIADISCSQSIGSAPLRVFCDALDSTDNDGTIVSYEWNLGDGTIASGPEIVHTYTIPGKIAATLTVIDDGGLTDTVKKYFRVDPPEGASAPPIAVISATIERGSEPLTVAFNAAGSYDPDGQIRNYNWNFGDGTTGSGAIQEHSFYHDAAYRVTLVVEDDSGLKSAPAEYTIAVADNDQPADKRTRENMLKVLPIVINFLLDSSDR